MKAQLEITVPQSLEDITLRQYIKYVKASDGVEDEGVLQELLLTNFCNIRLDHLPLLKYSQVQDILGRLQPLLDSFGKDVPFTQRFTLKGVEYGFIPNLSEISYGENKNVTTYMSEGINMMHKAMAVLYRPIVNTSKDAYSIEEYPIGSLLPSPSWEEDMMDMPLSVMMGAQVFFWTLIKDLLDHIPKYLEKEIGKEKLMELMQKASITTTGVPMMKSSV